jgi:hypothetical protein
MSCDALALKPSVEVKPTTLIGMDVSDFNFTENLLTSPISFSDAFNQFIHGHWEDVIHDTFMFQMQPLNPDLSFLVIHPQPNLMEKQEGSRGVADSLKIKSGKACITMGDFVADCDNGFDEGHDRQPTANLARLLEFQGIPGFQQYRAISEVLHFLKWVRYRILKDKFIVVRIDTPSAIPDLSVLKGFLSGDIRPIAFSDGPIPQCMIHSQ